MEHNGSNEQAGAQREQDSSLSNHTDNSDLIKELKINVHGRFRSSSGKFSFPVVATSPHGTEQCYQFPLAQSDEMFRPLRDVSWDKNREVLRACTPGGTDMVGLKDRGVTFDYHRENIHYTGAIVPMSPKRGQKPPCKVELFTDTVSTQYSIKQGHTQVIHQDIEVRSGSQVKRRPGQRQVMKGTAEEELADFVVVNKDKLTTKALQHIANHDGMEWLHIVAFSLTNLKDNPQVRGNLGAARKQDNTRMMVIEKVPKVLSRYSDVSVDLQGQFLLFPHTELVKDIAYEVSVHHGLTHLTVYQNTDVFSEYDYPRSTDQLIVLVIQALLQGRACHVSELAQLKQENSSESVSLDGHAMAGDSSDVMFWMDDESKVADHESVDAVSYEDQTLGKSTGLAQGLFKESPREETEERGHCYNLRRL